MSGSSLDGVDLALCEYSLNGQGEWSFSIRAVETRSFNAQWQETLGKLHLGSGAELARAHAEYGHLLGGWIHEFLERSPCSVGFVAVHGHTVFHRPDQRYTFQLGDGETIASYCDCPVICNFRAKDMALGGQGAPLVPCGERALFPETECFLNLGGIVNLSTPSAAFDVCVGNQILNALAERVDSKFAYDPEGMLAAGGRVDEGLLKSLASLEFYSIEPPKSLGREWGEANLNPLVLQSCLSNEDLLATYVEHVAIEIDRALAGISPSPRSIVASGGGCLNVYLVGRIRSKLDASGFSLVIAESEELVLYKEALIFAYLGLLNLLKSSNIDAALTGARASCVGGSVHLPLMDRPSKGVDFSGH